MNKYRVELTDIESGDTTTMEGDIIILACSDAEGNGATYSKIAAPSSRIGLAVHSLEQLLDKLREYPHVKTFENLAATAEAEKEGEPDDR